jgi:hypothetical protein
MSIKSSAQKYIVEIYHRHDALLLHSKPSKCAFIIVHDSAHPENMSNRSNRIRKRRINPNGIGIVSSTPKKEMRGVGFEPTRFPTAGFRCTIKTRLNGQNRDESEDLNTAP